MKITYEITDSELKEILTIAKGRNHKDPDVKTDPFAINHESLDVDICGFKGEWAVAKYLGTDVNKDIYRRKGDDKIDLSINANDKIITFQIKSTFCTYEKVRLYFDNLNEFKTDIAVLVRVINNTVEFLGWITKIDFLKIPIENRSWTKDWKDKVNGKYVYVKKTKPAIFNTQMEEMYKLKPYLGLSSYTSSFEPVLKDINKVEDIKELFT